MVSSWKLDIARDVDRAIDTGDEVEGFPLVFLPQFPTNHQQVVKYAICTGV